MVPGLEERSPHADRGGHARGEARGASSSLDDGNLLLEGVDRRVGRARVAVALGLVQVDALLNKGRGLEDGREDGARLLVGGNG